MEVEVAETVFGTFVPQHLLKFHNDASAQSYFRHVLETNYQKGISKQDSGHCQNCCSELSAHDRPRMKPSKRMTKRIRKLLDSAESKPLRKHDQSLVKKYWSSANTMVVKCPVCKQINRKSILTNEAKAALKFKLLSSSQSTSEVPEDALIKKKKKRKKRKNRADLDASCGLIIPASYSQKTTSVAPETLLQVEVKSASPSDTTVCDPKPFHISDSTSSKPKTTATEDKHGNNSSLQLSSTQTHQRSISSARTANQYQPSNLSSKLGTNKTQTSQRKRKEAVVQSAIEAKHKKLKHKQLKEFLSQDPAIQKPASLKDFLSSL